jgi:hypothetical protein
VSLRTWAFGQKPRMTVTDQDELGYGTVTFHAAWPNLYRRLRDRIVKPKPVTVHVGWEDEDGFHEVGAWRIDQ